MSRLILVAGGYPHHMGEAIIKAFAEAGWRTEFFDLSPESPWHKPFVKPVRKLIHNLRIKRHPETFDNTSLSNLGWRSKKWWERMQELKPDAALILRGNRIALPQLQAAKAARFPLFCWMVEPANKISSFLIEAQAGVYREMFVYARSYLDELKKVGATGTYYPHRALELPPESAVTNRQRPYQWSFLGAHSPDREKMIRAILPEFPNGYLQGSRWRHLYDDPLFKNVLHYGYFGQKECFDLYLKTQIGLDIASEESTGGLTMRIPELLACGCKVLMRPSPELEAIPWNPGTRLGFYRTAEELLTQLRETTATDQESPQEILALAQSVVGHRDMVGHIERALKTDNPI